MSRVPVSKCSNFSFLLCVVVCLVRRQKESGYCDSDRSLPASFYHEQFTRASGLLRAVVRVRAAATYRYAKSERAS